VASRGTRSGSRSGFDATQRHPGMGDRLRRERRAHGLSLRDLADRLGVSPSLISQVETGRAMPSVSTLYAIASELDVSLDDLLFDGRGPTSRHGRRASGPTFSLPPIPIQRSGDRKRIRLASGVTWERLTSSSTPGVDFLHVIYDVGGASSPADTSQRHDGHEWGYVISGTLQVTIGFDEYVLGPGDAVSIDSSVPHRLANIGDEPIHGIWFVLGRQPFDGHAPDDGDHWDPRPPSARS
jgi:transcriptional regulator with XRE-family HTH domain